MFNFHKFHLIKFVLVIGLVQAEEPKPEWNYHEIQGWKEHFSACGGAHQSPININTSESKGRPYPPLVFGNYHKLFDEMVTNNGHTVQFSLNTSSDKLPYITGGGLHDRFIFQQMHFHWGLESSRGSEHTINGRAFPAELHLVHYNSKYGSFNNSVPFQDGLAVLGILLQLEKFRELRNEEGDILEDNFRPVQELHDRVVTHREVPSYIRRPIYSRTNNYGRFKY